MPKHNQDGRTARFIQDNRDGDRGFGRGGQYGGGTSGGRSRHEHDDRNFKYTSHKSRTIQRKSKDKFNNHVDDSGDTIMDGAAGPSRFPNHGGGGGKRGNRSRGNNNKDWKGRGKGEPQRFSFGPGWHKITIVNGSAYTPEFILTSIAKESRSPIIPVAYTVMQGTAVFFVESRTEAESVAEISGRIVGTDSQKILIKVSATGAPPTPSLDGVIEVKLKMALEKRYNSANHSLNLECFYSSPDIIHSYYIPLIRGGVLSKILNLLGPVAETLVALDLSNNRLAIVDQLRILKERTPLLKILNLGRNKIRDIYSIDKLSGMQIQELNLEKNPLCNNYDGQDKSRYISHQWKRGVFPMLCNRVYSPCRFGQDVTTGIITMRLLDGQSIHLGMQNSSIGMKNLMEWGKFCIRFDSDIRKRFPKIIKLDGVDIPPQITFDLESPTKAPKPKGSFFCNDKAQQIVNTFIEQYFTIYDGEKRNDLLDAYHDKSCMSLCSSYPSSGYIQSAEQSKRLSHYLTFSRNLLRNSGQDKAKRIKLLRQGKQNIIDFLNKLPKTLHDTNAIIVDMPLATERFIQFTVMGVFKEREEKQQPLRSFSRTFFIVPQNQGYVIINEMLFITVPTAQQSKTAFKLPAPTPSPSPIPYVQQIPPPVVISQNLTVAPSATVSSLSQEEERNQMVLQFSQQSGLKIEWSKQCLEDNGWDFLKSASVFTELKAQGKVPAEFYQELK